MQHAELIAHYYETMGFADAEGVSRTYDGPGGGPMQAGIVVMLASGVLTIETLKVHGHINAGPIDSDARVMEEEYFIIICQADFETEFNGMPVDVITGLRYETYRCYCSSGLETPIVTNIAWVGGNEFSLC